MLDFINSPHRISGAQKSFTLAILAIQNKRAVATSILCRLPNARIYIWNVQCTVLELSYSTHIHTHKHICLTTLFPGLPGWAGTRKVKPVWILLKQETMSGSGISWATCKSASRSRQITMPVPHHSSFLQAGCPSCHPTNSVKAVSYSTEQQYKKITSAS